MTRRLAHVLLMALALACVWPAQSHAQDAGEPADGTDDDGQELDDPVTGEDAGKTEQDEQDEQDEQTERDKQDEQARERDFPSEPGARLERAKQAYSRGEYQLLRPLLQPTVEPESAFDTIDREIEARQLYGVGLFFEAQQTTKRAERRDLLDRTRRQFLTILRQNPDHELDPLNYPASVVEVFETVREDNAEELAELKRQREGDGGEVETETFYVERNTRKRWFAINFAPFGMGQFQNGNRLAGILFASSQASMLALNGIAYVGTQRADTNEDGLYTAQGADSEFAVARSWRNVQWIALGTFGALYLWSTIDGIARYESEDVRIRSLDEPPPELSAAPRAPRPPQVRIGIGSVMLRW